MDDNGKDNLPGCCDGGQCCSPAPTDADRKSARWKTLTFTTVLLLAGAVAAYSLFWRTPDPAASACCPPGSAAAAACAGTATVAGCDHTTLPVGLSIVVLLEADGALSSEALATIGDVRLAVESQGAQLQMETLRSGDSAFLRLTNQYAITTFPAVVASGPNGAIVLGNDQMRADTILSLLKPTSSTASDSTAVSGTR